MIPDNTPAKFINKDGTLNVVALVNSYLELEKKFSSPAATDKRLFPMTMDFIIPGDWVIAYVTERGFTVDQVERIADEWKFYWAEGNGKGSRKSKNGWRKCLHNRFTMLIERGKV